MELVRDNLGEIIKKHLEFNLSLKTSIHLAVDIGEMLAIQKEELPSGAFTSWVDENLPFSVRTAQNYMKLHKNREALELADPKDLTEAYLLLAPPPKFVEPEDEDDPEEEDLDILDDDPVENEPHNQLNILNYWDDLGQLVSRMDATYMKLSRLRNSTTPKALGSMIGNIKDMANVLLTWSPDQVKACKKCGGDGCDECVNGLTGLWKESSN
jgi:hypothetical protein